MPIAVLSVIGALGRAVFAVIPSFNPNSAVVIIAGMQFGPLAGFLTGSLSALASNMLLGQGPWTLWQMTAWGMMGCFAGEMCIRDRAGAFSDGKLSLSPDVGGTLPEILGYEKATELINEADKMCIRDR